MNSVDDFCMLFNLKLESSINCDTGENSFENSVRIYIKNVDTCRTNISCTYLSYTGISYSITSHIPQLNVSSILCVNLSSINI